MNLSPRRLLLFLLLLLACLSGASADLRPAAAGAQQAPKAGAPQTVAQPAPTSSAAADGRPLMLNVSVIDDKGWHALKLGPKAFTVYLDGVPQPLTHFGELDMPLSVGFVFDVSASMADIYKAGDRRGLSLVEELVARFVQNGHEQNEYFVIGFNQTPHLLQDTTRDRAAVLAAVRKVASLRPHGQSAFFDACYLAVEKASRGTRLKRAVVVVSDGQDNRSRYEFDDLKRLLREQDVLFYALAPYALFNDGMIFEAGLLILDELAKLSGGKSFLTHGTRLDVTMDYVAFELRHQYRLGIAAPAPQQKIKWRKLEVKVARATDPSGKPMKLSTRARAGFYTPAAAP